MSTATELTRNNCSWAQLSSIRIVRVIYFEWTTQKKEYIKTGDLSATANYCEGMERKERERDRAQKKAHTQSVELNLLTVHKLHFTVNYVY